jgi:hypothetical protein
MNCQRVVRSGRTCKRIASYFGSEGNFCSWHRPQYGPINAEESSYAEGDAGAN